ncbi:MAG: FAD-dependent oxidoreductase [Chloroflexota bacterium]
MAGGGPDDLETARMKLFEPGQIGNLTLKNRIVMAAMHPTGLITEEGILSPRGIEYHALRAKGGVGMITSGSFLVHREFQEAPSAIIFDSDKHMPWLKQLAEAVHGYGAKLAIALSPGQGRCVPLVLAQKCGAAGPSPLPLVWDPNVLTRELSVAEIKRCVDAFEYSARLLKDAGVDAIEINCHCGYILDEFMTTLWNKRTDQYGGSLKNRLRFVIEVIEAIKRGAGQDYPIIFKYGLTHYLDGGRTVEEGLEIAQQLEAAGVAAFDIDAGCYETPYWYIPPVTQPQCCNVVLAQRLKQVVSVPVISEGKLGRPDLAGKVIAEGKADFVALGRPLLADPEWANKVEAGQLEDVRPCIGDMEGCLGMTRQRKPISCTVNPAAGNEQELALKPAERPKTVLVVGGGPGGMEAAIVAAQRGHQVTLWEKTDSLGGNLVTASLPDFKADFRLLMEYLPRQLEKLGVDIELDKEASPELILEMNPEAVFIATGSSGPIIPEIPGVKKKHVVTAIDLILGRKEAGKSVAVIGGGLIGTEVALHLAQKGKRVTVIEILDSIIGDMVSISRAHFLKLLADNKVRVLTGTTVREITDDGVIVAGKSGKERPLKADTVVLAIGLRSDSKLAEALKDKGPEIYAIGDVVEPRKIINAMWEAYGLARLI